MDLVDDCSSVESVEENNLEIEGVPRADASDLRGNGSYGDSDVEKSVADGNIDDAASPSDVFRKGGEIGRPSGSLPTTAQSADGLTPPMTKGYGLKTWRRIRRVVVKDGNTSLDASKILKRGFYGSGNAAKPSRVPLEIGKDKEASVGSTSAVRNAGDADGFVSPSDLGIYFAAGPAFAAGADSDHSEDRSSKSSTAASAPKVKHDLPAALGYARERNRAKNLTGKGLGQQGKGRVESSKKPREEMVKIQKENSHSSVESDLRSSNSVFMQGAFLTAGNGMKSERSSSYHYSVNIDGAHQSGQYRKDGTTGYPKEIQDVVENISQDGSAAWEAEEEKDENLQSSAEQDPLDRSMRALQYVQEALEKEVEKFGEIAKEPVVPVAEVQISNLMENVKSLEVALEETRVTLQARESRISKLEVSLSNPMSPKDESASSSDLLSGVPMDEIESAFKQRIEAEIEYLAIVRTVQKLSVDLQSQLMLLTEQEAAREQKTMLDRLGEAETKAAALKKRAKELEQASEGNIEVEEVLKLRKRTCKATLYIFLQLLLLVFVVWFLMSQLSPQDAAVIPT